MPGVVSIATDSLLGIAEKAAVYTANSIFPIIIPGEDELIDLYIHNRIKYADMADRLLDHGVLLNQSESLLTAINEAGQAKLARTWQMVIEDSFQKFTETDLITLKNRGVIDATEFKLRLSLLGWKNLNPDPLWVSLTHTWPTVSDQARFSNQTAWDGRLIEKFTLNVGMPTAFRAAGSASGYGFAINKPELAGTRFAGAEWTDQFWWSHWEHPQTSQLFTMYHRLRKSLLPDGKPVDPCGETFTLADMGDAMRMTSINPYWYAKLHAISYKPLPTRAVRQLYEQGFAEKIDLIESFLDQQFSPVNARKMAQFTAGQTEFARFQSLRKQLSDSVLQAYEAGVVSRDDAIRQLHILRLRNAAEYIAFTQMPKPAQIAVSTADRIASMELLEADRKQLLANLKANESAVQHLLVKGFISAPDAINRLVAMGINLGRSQFLVTEWATTITTHIRELSTGEVLKAYRDGLVTPAVVQARLTHLGWQPADIPILVAESQIQIQLHNAQLAKIQAKTRADAAKAAAAVARAQRAASRQSIADLAKHGSPSQLEKWYRAGLIDDATFNNRMNAIGWPQADIDLVRNWVHQQQKPKPPKPPKPGRAAKPPKVALPGVATIKAWLKDGIIDASDSDARLGALGYDQTDIADFHSQWGF